MTDQEHQDRGHKAQIFASLAREFEHRAEHARAECPNELLYRGEAAMRQMVCRAELLASLAKEFEFRAHHMIGAAHFTGRFSGDAEEFRREVEKQIQRHCLPFEVQALLEHAVRGGGQP